MAFGIEARVPYLDLSLIKKASQFPFSSHINNTSNKLILRKIAQEYDLPNSIVTRAKRGAGNNTMEETTKKIDRLANQLISREYQSRHRCKFIIDKKKILFFDLLDHIFIKNEGKIPSGFEINDLY